ncbi:MAG: glutamate--tRNA ligase [Thermoplasmata archaeon]|nr:MAG: glutamate--tRNA ligase [Thermoplasmata archaeon]
MTSENIQKTARKYALQNAVQFEGSAQLKAVIGKVIAVFQKKGIHPKEIIPLVKKTVDDVNGLSKDQQRDELEILAPELLIKEKKVRDFSLSDLPFAEDKKVITRFPPEPNGYLHIGHAKAAIIDYEYAKKYDGSFILRFDDTNPEKDCVEFYDAQKQDLKWLGIKWDKSYHTSDNLKMHYELCLQLLKQSDAYVCLCDAENIKMGRQKKKNCPCRNLPSEIHVDQWEQLLSSTLDNGIVRLKADMKSLNTAMRDPTLFRIITTPHPLQKDRFHIWPTYDFAGAVEDSISGVTHPFRTKEYELRDEVYFYLLDKLGLRKPHLMEFARLSIEGMPVSKRKITPLIENGSVSGYDDVRLPTLRGLKKRGIVPKAIKKFVFSQGISKVESIVSFGLVEAENRKIIDPVSKRLFFVSDPVELIVSGIQKKSIVMPFHPTDKSLGTRSVLIDDSFYVPREDIASLNVGDTFRLKDLCNVKIQKKNDKIYGMYAGEELIAKSKKIQWTSKDALSIDVFKPEVLFKNDTFNENSLQVIHGNVEPAIKKLKDGEIVQFERFGFVRIEKENDVIKGFFTHR